MGAYNPSTRAAEIGTVLDLVEPVNFRLSETLPQKLKWKTISKYWPYLCQVSMHRHMCVCLKCVCIRTQTHTYAKLTKEKRERRVVIQRPGRE